jgi:hypothetical protein
MKYVITMKFREVDGPKQRWHLTTPRSEICNPSILKDKNENYTAFIILFSNGLKT